MGPQVRREAWALGGDVERNLLARAHSEELTPVAGVQRALLAWSPGSVFRLGFWALGGDSFRVETRKHRLLDLSRVWVFGVGGRCSFCLRVFGADLICCSSGLQYCVSHCSLQAFLKPISHNAIAVSPATPQRRF